MLKEQGGRAMKFWQLVSIMRSELAVVRAVCASKGAWRFVDEWLDHFREIVDARDRVTLDHALPDDLVRAVLRQSKTRFYLAKGVLSPARH